MKVFCLLIVFILVIGHASAGKLKRKRLAKRLRSLVEPPELDSGDSTTKSSEEVQKLEEEIPKCLPGDNLGCKPCKDDYADDPKWPCPPKCIAVNDVVCKRDGGAKYCCKKWGEFFPELCEKKLIEATDSEECKNKKGRWFPKDHGSGKVKECRHYILKYTNYEKCKDFCGETTTNIYKEAVQKYKAEDSTKDPCPDMHYQAQVCADRSQKEIDDGIIPNRKKINAKFKEYYGENLTDTCKSLQVNKINTLESLVRSYEMSEMVERVEKCNNKFKDLKDANYAYTLSNEIKISYKMKKKHAKESVHYKKPREGFGPGRENAKYETWEEAPFKMFFYEVQPADAKCEEVTTNIYDEKCKSPERKTYNKNVSVVSDVSDGKKNIKRRYCLERNLALLVGKDTYRKMVPDNNLHTYTMDKEIETCDTKTQECYRPKSKLNRKCKLKTVTASELRRECNRIFNTDFLPSNIKEVELQKSFLKETKEAYNKIEQFLDDSCHADNFKKKFDQLGISRAVCILQARGRGTLDQLGYADNYFKLVVDDNMVVETEGSGDSFRCKLFTSVGEDIGNFCHDRKNVVAKEHKLQRRRLLETGDESEQDSITATSSEEITTKTATCKTKFINLQKNGNGFGVYDEKFKDKKKKITLFLDKEKTTRLNNVVITSTDNGETTNYQVTLDCDKREKEGEIDRTFEVCKCDKDMKLYISIGGESSKECVYKVGPSWEMGKCDDRRRRLLSNRQTGC